MYQGLELNLKELVLEPVPGSILKTKTDIGTKTL